MLSSTSSFVASTVPLYHSAIKSLIFRAADVLVAVAVYKFFSLVAAIGNLFTPYLMFVEGYVQRALFVFSRGLASPSSLLVLAFTVAYFMSGFYGVMLWALDSPGYVLQTTNASIAAFGSPFLDDPAYIVYVAASPDKLGSLYDDLPRIVGSNLFKPASNLTLTGEVSIGLPQATKPTRNGTGGRIWLDDEGFSVSPDTAVMVSYKTDQSGQDIPLDCKVQATVTGGWGWNCTFDNTFAQPLIDGAVGLPEVHWDDASDLLLDSRYVRPNRRDNVWAALGQGGGTAAMKQVFTVTKDRRRHTFLETAFRATIVAAPPRALARTEIDDLLRRTWSTNASDQHAPLLARLSYSIDRAQARNQSFIFGLNGATNATAPGTGNNATVTTQTTWEYLTWENNQAPYYSLLRVTVTNITLVRSETLPESAGLPTPFEGRTCAANFMNLAYGGRVSDTDCTAGGTPPAGANLAPVANSSSAAPAAPRLFGTVDTAAVLILYGLGDGRSDSSAAALDEAVWEWTVDGGGAARMEALLLARAFAVGVDPALVAVAAASVVPAASWLQLVLVLLAAGAGALGWGALALLGTRGGGGPHWASTLLWNLASAAGASDDDDKGPRRPGRKSRFGRLGEGYMRNPPEVQLRVSEDGEETTILLNGRIVTAANNPVAVAHAPGYGTAVSDVKGSPGMSVEGGN